MPNHTNTAIGVTMAVCTALVLGGAIAAWLMVEAVHPVWVISAGVGAAALVVIATAVILERIIVMDRIPR